MPSRFDQSEIHSETQSLHTLDLGGKKFDCLCNLPEQPLAKCLLQKPAMKNPEIGLRGIP